MVVVVVERGAVVVVVMEGVEVVDVSGGTVVVSEATVVVVAGAAVVAVVGGSGRATVVEDVVDATLGKASRASTDSRVGEGALTWEVTRPTAAVPTLVRATAATTHKITASAFRMSPDWSGGSADGNKSRLRNS